MTNPTIPKAYLAGKEVGFTRSDYVGQGGFGTVFKKGGVAYKICHDPKNMIPDQKLRELKVLVRPNILGPRDVLTDKKGSAIGFTMPYVDKAEFLTRLFTKSFRTQNSVTGDHLRTCAMSLQDGVQFLHDCKILGVDLNEFNFLVSEDCKTIYFIDVDGYQTPSFPATAIMDTIRDRQGPKNVFNEGTDWFSTAVIMCQIYTGAHPYKPVHPDYNRTQEWSTMMDRNINIFMPESKMPPATSPLSTIPAGHLRWLYQVIHEKERIKPPKDPDTVNAPVVLQDVKARVVMSTSSFAAELVLTANGEILAMAVVRGEVVAFTRDAGYSTTSGKKIYDLPPIRMGVRRFYADGGFVDMVGDQAQLFDYEGEPLTSISGIKGAFVTYSGDLFLVSGSDVQAIRFRRMGGKMKATFENSGKVHSGTVKIFERCAVYDYFGRQHIVVGAHPYVRTVEVEMMRNHRIIDAVACLGRAVVLSEHKGDIWRTFVDLDKNDASQEASFVEELQLFCHGKDTEIYMHPVGDNRMHAFRDIFGQKVFTNVPCNSGDITHQLGSVVGLGSRGWGFAHGAAVYRVMKVGA
jgi:hypothetical protein